LLGTDAISDISHRLDNALEGAILSPQGRDNDLNEAEFATCPVVLVDHRHRLSRLAYVIDRAGMLSSIAGRLLAVRDFVA
jgi:hypothetical protein